MAGLNENIINSAPNWVGLGDELGNKVFQLLGVDPKTVLETYPDPKVKSNQKLKLKET